MSSDDTRFVGSIPEYYDSLLGPVLFEPHARDLAGRVRGLGKVARVLETAAGTGIVTRALARALPEAAIVATDLNDAMLKVAATKLTSASVTWKQADAQSLPFADGEFDAVVCQFGIMFFPDKPAGLREAKRVLKPGGTLLFNVWDTLARNPLSLIIGELSAARFPDDPPRFLERGPFGWNDPEEIRRVVLGAGFARVDIDTVNETTTASAADLATGYCKGSPLRMELEARAPGRLDEVTAAMQRDLEARFGLAPIENRMSVLVVVAS